MERAQRGIHGGAEVPLSLPVVSSNAEQTRNAYGRRAEADGSALGGDVSGWGLSAGGRMSTHSP